jgi:hypothetical protein
LPPSRRHASCVHHVNVPRRPCPAGTLTPGGPPARAGAPPVPVSAAAVGFPSPRSHPPYFAQQHQQA